MLRAMTAAFKSRDSCEYRTGRDTLNKTAKGQYRVQVESCYSGSNTRHMWSGLNTITDKKGKRYSVEEVNTFYAHFEKHSKLELLSPGQQLSISDPSGRCEQIL